MATLAPGTTIGRYTIHSRLGQGGMGVVYLALDAQLERQVALKVIAAALADDPEFEARFVAESRSAAAVDHPHLLPIFEAGEDEGRLYLAMRYVPGFDLSIIIARDGELSVERAVRFVGQVASALDAAHAAGLVHRDVKPGNVLVGPDEHAYLADFGLATTAASGSRLTRPGQLAAGSADYLAPELIEGGSADARSDVYALACLAYACLTGQPPFRRGDEIATLYAHVHEPPPSPSRLRPEMPPQIEHVLGRGLAKDPAQRYPSAGDFAAALARAAGDATDAGAEVATNASRASGREIRLPRQSAQTTLPTPASSFVGRRREIEEATELLRNAARLVTLTGPGGTGKSRLAVELAAVLLPSFDDGVFWVPLAPIREPARVTETIASAIGADGELASYIGHREILLVVDNLEHVISASPQLATLLEACPRLRILVTSRERLRVKGEIAYPVSPLAGREAVELFSERSGVVADATIEALCNALENLPLAIELAAARTDVISPSQILARIGQRLDLLKGGRDADERQRTLRATIEWSHELLHEEERRLFRALSVFRGGCTLEAGQVVAGGDLDSIGSLVDKSLVRRRGERYLMLETIREYAAQQLEDAGEEDEISDHHARYFIELATPVSGARFEELSQSSPRHDQTPWDEAWLQQAAEEHHNFAGALEWLAESGRSADVTTIVEALWFYWLASGHSLEGERWTQLAVDVAEDQPPERIAFLLGVLGEFPRYRNETARALAIKRQALAVNPATDGAQLSVSALEDRASTLADIVPLELAMGDLRAARESAEEAWRLRTRLGKEFGIAHALVARGEVALAEDDAPGAERLFREARALWAKAPVGHVQWIEDGCYLAEAMRRQGKVREAAELFRETALEAARVNFQGSLVSALLGLAWLAMDDEPLRAAKLLGVVEETCRRAHVSPFYLLGSAASLSESLGQRLGSDEFKTAVAAGRTLEELDGGLLA